jgi:hypothetical protein
MLITILENIQGNKQRVLCNKPCIFYPFYHIVLLQQKNNLAWFVFFDFNIDDDSIILKKYSESDESNNGI